MVSGWLDLAFREEGEVKKHVFREKSFLKKWEATKHIALRKYYVLMGGDTKKREKNTHTTIS